MKAKGSGVRRAAVKRVGVKRVGVKRVAVKETVVVQEAEVPVQDSPAERPLRPSQCRTFMRDQLAREFRGIVQGFVQEAKSGSCQHVKLATELLDSKRKAAPAVRSGRRTLKRLVDRLDQIEG